MSLSFQGLKDKIDYYKKKGNERITIMVIPHNEKHLFNLQLSKVSIAFSFLIVLGVILTSLLAIELQENIQNEVDTLYDVSAITFNEREQYIQKFTALSEKQQSLHHSVLKLFKEAEMDSQIPFMFLNEDEIYKTAEKQLAKESKDLYKKYKIWITRKGENEFSFKNFQKELFPKMEKAAITENFKYHSEVIAYRQLHLSLKQTIKSIYALKTFLEEREFVQKSLPYSWPLHGGHFTSFYGVRIDPTGFSREFHPGIDLAKSKGSDIVAAADGIARTAGRYGGYGNAVILSHRFGFETLYAHMSRILIQPGQQIHKGQVIGKVGSSGRATGPHLHYEIHINGKTVNPMRYLSSSI